MSLPRFLATLLVWQMASNNHAPTVAPTHFRFEREISLPAGEQGQACLVLDAAVYAHAAESSARDVRIFAGAAAVPSLGALREVPYAMSESDTQPGEDATAGVGNVAVHGSDLSFDLAMPARAYSAVALKLDAPEFVGIAHVLGRRSASDPGTPLGSFLLFDLSKEQLPRSTTLALAEASYPLLHVSIRMVQPDGHLMPRVTPAMIAGANVPPSREAQVLYTTVAQSGAPEQDGQDTVLRLPVVPEHVPVEHVRFMLEPRAHASFLRAVTLTAAAGTGNSKGEPSADESLGGSIAFLQRPGVEEAPAIHYESLDFPATLGATLGSSAQVVVRIHNGSKAPPPIASVALEMRRRSLCFDASPGEHYTMFYGDASIAAAAYDYARHFAPSTHAAYAQLDQEQPNPSFAPRAAPQQMASQHPEAMSVGVLILIAAAGLAGLESVKRKRDR
ncbi:hypothetical protein SAMN05421819_1470 [Bryocella elongata]|uniref:Uncharacterized protein n=1 Tax=Bryocella elongata TaxID=863522 RepID=A0A1H5W7X7_9BACT|nr:hypothetical protein [Bryocella elongata]SEF95448.1 hypothetical protein SAMN05421819_1470 [Bryocella elongata]